MAKKDISVLRTYFETGDIPTQQQFWDTLDSFFHVDGTIAIENITGLTEILAGLENIQISDVEGLQEALDALAIIEISDVNGLQSVLNDLQTREISDINGLTSALTVINNRLYNLENNYVPKEGTKQLSDENFTSIYKGVLDAGVVGEAPSDGKKYGRRNLSWEEIIQPNALLSSVAPTRSVNTFTYPATQYSALINGTTRTNPAQLVTTIDVASTADHKRVDLIYFKSDNTLVKIVGTESLTVAERPSIPIGIVGVEVSFINVFGTVVNTPVPVDKLISVQNSQGIEQFKVDNYFRFRGGIFNPATKEIIVSPLTVNTAYVHSTNGNDATAEFQNADKPYKTVDKVFQQWTGENPTKFVRVVILDNATYAINGAYPLINFEIFSDFACTLDFTANANPYLFSIYNGVANYTFSFNLRNGRLYNNRGGSGFQIATTDGYFDIIVNEIYWNSTTSVFYGTSLYLTFLKKLSLKAPLSQNATGFLRGAVDLDVLTILAGATAGGIYGSTITVRQLTMNANVLIFADGETWNIGNVTGSLYFSYSHDRVTRFNFMNSVISGGIYFDQNIGTKYFSGTILSTSFGGTAQSYVSRPLVLNFINLTILNLTGAMTILGGYVTLNFINCYIKSTGISYLFRNTGKDGACTYNFEKTTLRQDVAGTLLSLDNNTNVSSINLGGFESNVNSVSNIVNSPVTFDLMSFKDKKREQVIRSKVDLIGRVLSSQTTYIIDGVITLLTGEYIEVPAGGLTIVGYGFDVSQINKNVAGQSIFTSPVGNSGNFVSKDLQYNSGAGSVFDVTDSDGSHAIELNDINFQSCASLGKFTGYRQFTGTTCGFYSCSDGLIFEGNWSGFKLTNSNIIGFGASGTLFKKGTATLFSNRFYIDLNLQVATGSKICDFAPANFTNNKSLQVVNCYVKVNGVVDPTTTNITFPNISETDIKAYFVNNIGLKNSYITPYGIASDNLLSYADDAGASAGGIIQIGQFYIETSTGYLRKRLT